MRLWKKPEPLPVQLQDALLPKEKVFSWAHHGGGLVAATDLGIITIDNHDATRIPWAVAIAGKWEPPLLTVTCLPDMSSVGWQLDDPGMLPQAVRDRITAHVLIDRVINFPGHGTVRFIATRTAEGVKWLTNSQDETWAKSPAGQAAISAELATLRSALGI